MNISFISTDVKGGFLSQFFNKELLQKKIKAFSIHLLLSTFIISSFFLFAINYWFPNGSLELSGIKNILFIIMITDLTLGPILTFLVFNPIKKSLKFDLSAIIVLQLIMLIYGIYTVYIAHPVYITFTVDRFTLVSARDANPQKAKLNEYKTSKISKPIYAYAESPKDPDERNSLLFSSVSGGLDLEALSQYYHPYEDSIHKIITKGWDPEKVFVTKTQKQLLESFLKDSDLSKNDIVFIPAQGKAKFMTFGIDKKTAQPVAIFDIDPWDNKG